MTAPSPTPSGANFVKLYKEVLTFWFGDILESDWPTDNRSTLWFGGGAEQDRLIADRFGDLVEQGLTGGLQAWEGALHSRLALIILLDQFARNIHRGTARAFAGDARAQQLVWRTLQANEDLSLPRVARVFLYMPLMHAEDLALQDECVARFTDLVENAPEALVPTLTNNLKFAREHRDIIATHGRFPHRNAALGRPNTPEETTFLQHGPRYGQ